MNDDIEFSKRADAFMDQVFELLQDEDPDELDPDLAMGVLAIEFADGRKCILNRQVAAHQIWLAHGAEAWHFAADGDQWMDTKGRGELREILGRVLTDKVGREIKLTGD